MDELAFIDPILDLESNDAGSLSFIVPPTHKCYREFLFPNSTDSNSWKQVIKVEKDGELIWTGRIIGVEPTIDRKKIVTCEGSMACLNDVYLSPKRRAGQTAITTIMTDVLNVYNNNLSQNEPNQPRFYVSTSLCDARNVQDYEQDYSMTPFNALSWIIENVGGYFYIDYVNKPSSTFPNAYYINYKTSVGVPSSNHYGYGVNLLDFKLGNQDELYSAVLPIGKELDNPNTDGSPAYTTIANANGGVLYLEDTVRTALLGSRRFIYLSYPEETNATNLKNSAQSYLNGTNTLNTVTGTASVIDPENKINMWHILKVELNQPGFLDTLYLFTNGIKYKMNNLGDTEYDFIALENVSQLSQQRQTMIGKNKTISESLAVVSDDLGVINQIYPVGSIYMSVSATAPEMLFPGTQWDAWGSGRVPVCFDKSQSQFNAPNKTGGNLEVAAHSHTSGGPSTTNTGAESAHTHEQNIVGSGQTGSLAANYFNIAVAWSSNRSGGAGAGTRTNAGSSHTHSLNSHTHTVNSSGSGDNMPPFIVCYMWVRTR